MDRGISQETAKNHRGLANTGSNYSKKMGWEKLIDDFDNGHATMNQYLKDKMTNDKPSDQQPVNHGFQNICNGQTNTMRTKAPMARSHSGSIQKVENPLATTFTVKDEDEMEGKMYDCLREHEGNIIVNGTPMTTTFVLNNTFINWSVYKVDNTADGIAKMISTTTVSSLKGYFKTPASKVISESDQLEKNQDVEYVMLQHERFDDDDFEII
ncbi:hypothetical protein VM1G_00129 [Cytospora mali]|uniref:Uncharacterized protein n=1 Tax=Cytospora mali TaxID=578113 RepID=A0A194VLT2_CYTMA|nr:hypothetical protein VM1G_00129 [Valsa mali]